MWTITLVKFRRPVTKADSAKLNQVMKDWAAKGIKPHEAFYTLGRYDQVWIGEAPNEKVAMQFAMAASEATGGIGATETMVAVSRDEVLSWFK